MRDWQLTTGDAASSACRLPGPAAFPLPRAVPSTSAAAAGRTSRRRGASAISSQRRARLRRARTSRCRRCRSRSCASTPTRVIARRRHRPEVPRLRRRPPQQRGLARARSPTVPYERRLLLLPKCLRVEDKCPAPFDEFGLLCKNCGLCSIQDLQDEAERLGYAVLVAEGSAIVMAIIQTGKIDAIVGVSCLSVLEKRLPVHGSGRHPRHRHPAAAGRLQGHHVDLDWVWDVIHLTSDDSTYRLDLDALRREVDAWFDAGVARRDHGPGRRTRPDRIARDVAGARPASAGGRSSPPAPTGRSQRRPGRAASRRPAEARRRRRVLPQGLAHPRRHRGRRRHPLRRARRCTPSTASRSRSTSATCCWARATACSPTAKRRPRPRPRCSASPPRATAR